MIVITMTSGTNGPLRFDIQKFCLPCNNPDDIIIITLTKVGPVNTQFRPHFNSQLLINAGYTILCWFYNSILNFTQVKLSDFNSALINAGSRSISTCISNLMLRQFFSYINIAYIILHLYCICCGLSTVY